ncbi:MAG: choice-of-anchor B family protein, partial [Rhodothermales bacterium]|nr:choice-of-anchor B family protein [Rhodothermales bacterium]
FGQRRITWPQSLAFTLWLALLAIAPWETSAQIDSIRGARATCTDGLAAGHACSDMDLLSFVSRDELGIEFLTDVEPWLDPQTGRPFLITSGWDGVAVLDASDALNPVVLTTFELPAAVDIKVYEGHLYVTTEASEALGLRSYRMGDLVAGIVSETSALDAFHQGHNLSLSPEAQRGYISLVAGGLGSCKTLLELDLTDPARPSVARCLPDSWSSNNRWSHNAECLVYDGPDEDFAGQELCFMAVPGSGLVLMDVTDKAAEKGTVLGMVRYPDEQFAHQGVLTADRRYFLMGDEGRDGDKPRMIIIDVADLSDPVVAGFYETPRFATDHDIERHGNRLYWSLYSDGMRILEFNGPDQITELGYFRTMLSGVAISAGTWDTAVLPGVVAATSAQRGIYLLSDPTTAVSVEEGVVLDWELSVYPNPASHVMNLQVSGAPQGASLRLIDVAGREVLYRTLSTQGLSSELTIDVGDLAPGVYLARVQSGESVITKALTILR